VAQSTATYGFGVNQYAILAAEIFDDRTVGIRRNLGMVSADEVMMQPYIVSFATAYRYGTGLDPIFLF